MMKAIDTSRKMYDEIFIEGTVEEKCLAWNRVLQTLVLTAGLWSELRYCYKAGEICEAIEKLCSNEQEREETVCQHWKTHHKHAELLTECSGQARRTKDMMHRLQNEYMYG